ncbi:hypothetical protein Nepgr_004843 [Nepenthes gracilis]|uniref:HMA domain-containing protein n=1 Tax=Nepenthes gracilis TaxID=150966 RepID=A0AAD3S294_NEPGR|nr:hypothetical protein Nepgr_004843 [Nepenthes gracilis]
MESTVSPLTSLLSISKILNNHRPISDAFLSHRHFSTNRPLIPRLRSRISTRKLFNEFFECDTLSSIRYLYAVVPPVRPRLAHVSSSVTDSVGAGGGVGGENGVGGGSGSGDGSEGGNAAAAAVSGAPDNVSALSSDVVVLDVRGMTCEGCAASVKRILESQLQVSSATVNLTTGTAIVDPASELKAASNWQQQLGEMLAKHLTSCGYKSNLQSQGPKEGDNP